MEIVVETENLGAMLELLLENGREFRGLNVPYIYTIRMTKRLQLLAR